MREDKANKKINWCDFECTLGELIKKGYVSTELDVALSEIRDMFVMFLNDTVDSNVLIQMSKDAEENKWGITSLSKFLGDLSETDYCNLGFAKRTDHYDLYNYLFINFNYTSLFDNYIYLDRNQFVPNRYKTIDTNFSFWPNPNGYSGNVSNEKTVWSSYIMTNTIHPHGYQNIPRSLLFGIEDEKYLSNKELNRFNKSYWAQNDKKYAKYFDDASLFVIYGASISETDSWWWKKVYGCLLEGKSELIIYYYNIGLDCEHVKQIFIDACKITTTKMEIESVKEKIYVVLYEDGNENILFAMNSKK